MRAILAALVVGGLLLAGCGSDEPAKPKPSPGRKLPDTEEKAPEQKQWSDYGPGDPRGDSKALLHAKKAAGQAQASRQDVPVDPEEK
jgi:hypothetical protein